MKTKFASTLLLALAALLTACGKPAQPPATATTEAGMPNPASVYCEDQGGTLEIRDEAGGQVGYCKFADGSECEEWAYFRGECAPAGAGIANPASIYCEDQGGTLEIRDEAGGQVGYCKFADGSECEEWAYFRGECAPAGAGIANPASVYCEDQGGTLEIRDEAGSQVGYCKFADGSECEEWAYFRGECAPASAQQTPAAGELQPLDSAACEEIRSAAAGALGVEATAANAPFQDPISGKSGSACQVTLTGTGASFQNPDAVVQSLKAALEPQGWMEDVMYAAGGPTGIGTGMRKDTQLCVLMAGWTPSEDANCPSDKPISECSLTPEQHLYTITLTCAQEQ